MLLYYEPNPKTGFDLWVLPMVGERKPAPFLRSEFNELHGRFAPNAKWGAYASDESGRFQVYVQPYPVIGTGAKSQISRDGGHKPMWRRDGKELCWLDDDGTLMAAEVSTDPVFRSGNPQPLFETGITDIAVLCDVSGDGKRFLIPMPVEDRPGPRPVTVVQNWLAGVKE